MRKSLNIRLGIFLTVFFATATIWAQNQLGQRDAFSFKLYSGPVFFAQPDVPAPMPSLGIKTSFIINTTELEAGVSYAPKLFEKKSGDPGYSSVFYSFDYLYTGIHIHQRIVKIKRHILSGSLGASMIFPLNHKSDTTRLDGSHGVNKSILADKGLGVNLETSFRYTYQFHRKMAFYTGIFFNVKLKNEYSDQWQGHVPDPISYYYPPTERISYGLMFGIQFLIGKNTPGFFLDPNKKVKKETNF